MLEFILGNNIHILLKMFSAFWLSLIIYLSCGTKFVDFLHHHQEKGQPIRDDGPKSHLQKKGTPTMGGALILFAAIISTLLFADLKNIYVLVCIFVIVAYGVAGFVDDYEKITRDSSKAMSAKMKLLVQFCAAFVAVCAITYATSEDKRYALNFPYLIDVTLNLWYFYVPFAIIVIAGASNGVNLADGLDGLASGLLILAFGAFAVVAYYVGFSDIVYVTKISGAGEVAVVGSAVVGACLGFLWFNAPKAKVFMGDTGSLALGGLLGVLAVLGKFELLLVLIGAVFVCETLSVIIQVASFKLTGKRVFKMSPIHHHFELSGWSENKIVIVFALITLISSALAVALYYFKGH